MGKLDSFKYSILVVDDDPVVRRSMEELLSRSSKFKSIVVAKDGVDASRKAANQAFDLVIADINLPKKDGLTFLAQEIEAGRDPNACVLISGQFSRFSLDTAKSLKIDTFLVKPVDSKDFLVKIINKLKKLS